MGWGTQIQERASYCRSLFPCGAPLVSPALKTTSLVRLMTSVISRIPSLISAVFLPSWGRILSFRQEAPEASVSLPSEEPLWTLSSAASSESESGAV